MAIAFSPLFSQEPANGREHRACVLITQPTLLKCQSTKDSRPEARAYAEKAKVGDLWWPNGSSPITFTFAADRINQLQDPRLELIGHVEINTRELVLLADGAVFDEKTGEIEARGVVRVKPR